MCNLRESVWIICSVIVMFSSSGCASSLFSKDTVESASREAGRELGESLITTTAEKIGDPAFREAVRTAIDGASEEIKAALINDPDVRERIATLGTDFGSSLGDAFANQLWKQGDGLDKALSEFTDRLNDSTDRFSATLNEAYEKYGVGVEHVEKLSIVEGKISRQDSRVDRLVEWSEHLKGEAAGSQFVLDVIQRWFGVLGGWIVAVIAAALSGGLLLRQRKQRREASALDVHVRATGPAAAVFETTPDG